MKSGPSVFTPETTICIMMYVCMYLGESEMITELPRLAVHRPGGVGLADPDWTNRAHLLRSIAAVERTLLKANRGPEGRSL